MPVVLALSELATRTVIGAAVGGLLATGLTLTITGWRERRKTHDEDVATIRLIEMELGNALRAATYIKDHGAAYTEFPITAWESGRIRLARSLDALEWLLVLNAYDAIRGWNWRYQHDQEMDKMGDDATPELEPQAKREEPCQRVIIATRCALPALKARSS
jgi:hypothetical protein